MIGGIFFFNPAHPNRFEPNEVEQTLFSLFLWRDSWNNHLVKCQHQSSISSLLWPDPQVQNKWAASPGFYEFNKCVQHFTIENKGKNCVTAAASTHRGNAYFFYWKRERDIKWKFWNSADLIKCSKGTLYLCTIFMILQTQRNNIHFITHFWKAKLPICNLYLFYSPRA